MTADVQLNRWRVLARDLAVLVIASDDYTPAIAIDVELFRLSELSMISDNSITLARWAGCHEGLAW